MRKRSDRDVPRRRRRRWIRATKWNYSSQTTGLTLLLIAEVTRRNVLRPSTNQAE